MDAVEEGVLSPVTRLMRYSRSIAKVIRERHIGHRLLLTLALIPCIMEGREVYSQPLSPDSLRRTPGSGYFISNVGTEVVSRSTLGVLAEVKKISNFKGATVGRVKILKLIHGQGARIGDEILVMAGTLRYFTPVGSRIVLFLEKLQRNQFKAISRITLESRFGIRKFQVLKRVLAIEREWKDIFPRAKKLKEYLFRVLAQDHQEIGMIALRELHHLSERHINVFHRRDLGRMNLLDLQKTHPMARSYLNILVKRLRQLPDRNREIIEYHRRKVSSTRNVEGRVQVLIETVKELGDDSITILVPLLNDDESRIRQWVAYHLGKLGDPVAAQSLQKRMRIESDLEVKSAILEALGWLRITAAVKSAVEALEVKKLRKTAILTLARIKSREAEMALRTFKAKLTESDDPEDREGVKFIDFVFSDKFIKQEKKLKEMRNRIR